MQAAWVGAWMGGYLHLGDGRHAGGEAERGTPVCGSHEGGGRGDGRSLRGTGPRGESAVRRRGRDDEASDSKLDVVALCSGSQLTDRH